MIKKADVILAVVILIASFAFIGVSAFAGGKGEEVCITVDGEQYASYPLDEDRTETVATAYGVNTVVISGGSVSVTDADCPDKYCVSHIEISREGETIVCLPHRLTVEIRGRNDG